jgi:hypothetical protein
MSWTNVPKPIGANYTRINSQGKQEYDQFDLTYDDPTIFYDSTNEAAWTGVVKPALPTWNDLTVSWNSYTKTWEEPNWSNINKPT